jgi:FtsP/CotA-like multicopper oxidase with cupredoxin domain
MDHANMQHKGMVHDGMLMDELGMVMNENHDNVPKDCKEVSGDIDLTIRAGREHAEQFNGKMFAFDKQQWDIPACSRINLTFINDDEVRHQLMVHNLPGYIYPKGMFTIELNGKGERKASFIVSSRPKTYLIHCEVPQHMEKGMKGQLKVAGGDGDLPSIPGITADVTPDSYPVEWNLNAWGLLLFSIFAGYALTYYLRRIL